MFYDFNSNRWRCRCILDPTLIRYDQASVGEQTDLQGDDLKGGPVLIPIGAASIGFGALWLFYGIKGFKRPGEEVGMKRCPHCGKTIEEDLNFCYHCATTFITPEEMEREMRSVEEEEKEDPGESTSDDGPSKGQLARMRRQQERRPSSDNEVDGMERRATPLKGLEGGGKGQ